MGKLLVCVLGMMALVLGGRVAAEETALPATKDAKITCWPEEQDWNCGKTAKLRAKGIQKNSAEIIIMDFDRAALKALLDKNAGKDVAAKLVLTVAAVGEGPATLEVAALDCGCDWTEGNKDSAKADKGECSYLAAQTDTKKWCGADGKDVDNFRELVFDVENDKVKTLANSKTVEVSADAKTAELPLDPAFVKHLATDANCRGVLLFHRGARPKVDFYCRDEAGKEPKLVLTVK